MGNDYYVTNEHRVRADGLTSAAGDVFGVVLAHVGQGRAVVDAVVGAQCAQVPGAGIDLDGLHPHSFAQGSAPLPMQAAGPFHPSVHC